MEIRYLVARDKMEGVRGRVEEFSDEGTVPYRDCGGAYKKLHMITVQN